MILYSSFGKLTATLEQVQDRVTQSMNTINYVMKFGEHNLDTLLGQDIDLGFYPNSRVYMIGTNIKF